jgi:hypothetical protein
MRRRQVPDVRAHCIAAQRTLHHQLLLLWPHFTFITRLGLHHRSSALNTTRVNFIPRTNRSFSNSCTVVCCVRCSKHGERFPSVRSWRILLCMSHFKLLVAAFAASQFNLRTPLKRPLYHHRAKGRLSYTSVPHQMSLGIVENTFCATRCCFERIHGRAAGLVKYFYWICMASIYGGPTCFLNSTRFDMLRYLKMHGWLLLPPDGHEV